MLQGNHQLLQLLLGSLLLGNIQTRPTKTRQLPRSIVIRGTSTELPYDRTVGRMRTMRQIPECLTRRLRLLECRQHARHILGRHEIKQTTSD